MPDAEVKVLQTNANNQSERRTEIVDDKSKVVSSREAEKFEMMVIRECYIVIVFVVVRKLVGNKQR